MDQGLRLIDFAFGRTPTKSVNTETRVAFPINTVFTFESRDGFGPGPAQGPIDFGWAGPAQIGLGPKRNGPNPSLRNGLESGPALGQTIWSGPGQAQTGLGSQKFGPNPSLFESYNDCLISDIQLTYWFKADPLKVLFKYGTPIFYWIIDQ